MNKQKDAEETQLTLAEAKAEIAGLKEIAYQEGTAARQMAFASCLAILSRVTEPQGWQPIETAPKDGTPILVGFENSGSIYIVRWWVNPEPMTWDGLANEEYGWLLAETTKVAFMPTHWMPLPTPPEADRG